MQASMEGHALSERVLGLSFPNLERLRRSPQGDRRLAMAMLLTSALGSFGALALWAAGHGVLGARLFCGCVLLLLVLLRIG